MRMKLNFKNFFLIFLILQPILDCYLLYSDAVINFFGFSPTTIIRMIVICIYFVFALLINNKGRQKMVIYMLGLLVYAIVHHFISISIDNNLIYKTFRYSMIDELFYFFRMFMPIATAYIVYSFKYTKDDLKLVIKYSSILVSVIIIGLNVTKLAFSSYGTKRIAGTIFNWLNSEFVRSQLASRGWFNSANQIGGLIIILLIIMEYFVLSECKKSDYIILLFLIVSAMMLGTRIASSGACYVTILMFISHYFIHFIKKDKNKVRRKIIPKVFLLLFFACIYLVAPIVNCDNSNFICLIKFDSGLDSSSKISVKKDLKYNGDTCDFLKKTPVPEVYYEEIYPCNDNIEFWHNFVLNKIYKYANNRTLELLITKDIYSKTRNLSTNLFGISRSRFLNGEMYLEKDIYVHYYTIGILGIILFIIVPYFAPCMYILKKRKLDIYSISLCYSMGVPILFSYMSGHIIDELIVSLYLGFVSGMILNYAFSKKQKSISDRVLIVNDERMTGGVSVLLEDILNNIDKSIKIDLLILHNHGTRLNNLPPNVNIIYGTKFFNVIDFRIMEVIKGKNLINIIRKCILVILLKTGLIRYKIESERDDILKKRYKLEIAFKDGFCGMFTGYGDSIKKIQWLHSDYANKDFSLKYRNQFMKLYNNFDNIVAVSEPVSNSFANIYGQNEKILVINNLVDILKVKKMSQFKKIKYNEKLNFISVGRLHIDKGFDTVIKVLAKLKKEGLLNNFKYRIIGDGEEMQSLKNLININDLNNHVILCGRIDNPYPYIANSDLLIVSSIHESFGLVIVEALSLGVPVISTKIATIDKLLNSNYGVIVDNNFDALYNEIKEILSNQKKLKLWKNNLKGYHYQNDKIINAINKLLSIKE